MKLTKSFWVIALCILVVALCWLLPIGPAKVSRATAFFGIGALIALYFGGRKLVVDKLLKKTLKV